jgi:hypothetical protein
MSDQIISWFYGIVAQPVKTLREIARENPANAAFMIYLGVTVLNLLVSLSNRQSIQALEDLMLEANIRIPFSVIIASSILISIISIFIITGLLHLLARSFKGDGGYWNLFSAYAFAGFPMIIGVPVNFISVFMGPAVSTLAGIINFGISIWVLILQIIAVRESHNLSTGTSIGVYLLHLVILVGGAILLVILMAVTMLAL